MGFPVKVSDEAPKDGFIFIGDLRDIGKPRKVAVYTDDPANKFLTGEIEWDGDNGEITWDDGRKTPINWTVKNPLGWFCND